MSLQTDFSVDKQHRIVVHSVFLYPSIGDTAVHPPYSLGVEIREIIHRIERVIHGIAILVLTELERYRKRCAALLSLKTGAMNCYSCSCELFL